MIEVLPAPDHVVAVRISGTLTGDDYEVVMEETEAKLGRHERIAMYLDLEELADVTGEAIAKRVRYGLSKLGELHRFPRAAVVSDKQWIAAIASMSGKFLPKFSARVFPPAERDAAMVWASEPL